MYRSDDNSTHAFEMRSYRRKTDFQNFTWWRASPFWATTTFRVVARSQSTLFSTFWNVCFKRTPNTMAPLRIPINLPPRQIRLDSRSSSASTLTNSSGGDDVFYQRLGLSKSSSSKVPPSVKVRPSREHNIIKDFQRSQGLQVALDRIQERRLSDPLYQGEKGADPKEVKQMVDLFSKYEGILEHLVHKNQKLKSYVKGETEVYPSEFSCTTVDILETLEKLKLTHAEVTEVTEVLEVTEVTEVTDVTDASRAGAFDKRDIRSRSAGPRVRTINETTLQKNPQETHAGPALRSHFRNSSRAREAATPKRSGASLNKSVSTLPCPRRYNTPKRLGLRQNDEGDIELESPRASSKPSTSGSDAECYSLSSNRSREDPPANKPHSNGWAKAQQSQTIADSPVSPESRNEQLSPPSIRRETRRPTSTPLGEVRASPPRFDLVERKRRQEAAASVSYERKRQEAATSFSYRDSETKELGTVYGKESESSDYSCYELEGLGGQSMATPPTPPRTPPKHFLPVSQTKQEHNTVPSISRDPYSMNGFGSGSRPSIAPSERARKLQSEISNVYQYSQELAASQQRLRGDVQKIEHTYRQKHGCIEDRVFQAMPSPRDGLHFERGHDPMQLAVSQLSCESYTYIESGDGVIHVGEEESIHPILGSRPSYHIEDGIIVVEDDDAVEIENYSISNTITYVEDDQESFPDILDAAIPDSAQNGPRIDYSYSADSYLADKDETEFNSDDSMGGSIPTDTDNENSLQSERKSERETIVTIVSQEQLGKEVLRRSTGSLMHTNSSICTSISTKESAGLNKNKAELEFVVPAAKEVSVPRNKKVKKFKKVRNKLFKAVTWTDHCGALPCGLASF